MGQENGPQLNCYELSDMCMCIGQSSATDYSVALTYIVNRFRTMWRVCLLTKQESVCVIFHSDTHITMYVRTSPLLPPLLPPPGCRGYFEPTKAEYLHVYETLGRIVFFQYL